VPFDREVRLKDQDAGGRGIRFRDAALRGEGGRQQHVHYAEPRIALSGAPCCVRCLLVTAVREMPERQRLIGRINYPIEGAEPEDPLAPFEGTFRLARPPHCDAAEDARDAARRTHRKGRFEGFDSSGPIVLDQRDREPSQREGGGVVAAMRDCLMGVAYGRGGNLRVCPPRANTIS